MRYFWRKLGLLYAPQATSTHPKLMTHAANPVPVLLDGDVYRVFYSGRDGERRSSVGAVDIDIVKRRVVRHHHEPMCMHGAPGTFYSEGISIGNYFRHRGKRYIGFMGWRIPPGEHWRGHIGRLVLRDDMTLEVDPDIPYLDLDHADPLSLSYPWIEPGKGNSLRMWYGSTVTWDAGNGEMVHVIKQAASGDGVRWTRNGLAVPYQVGVAQAFSRPTVAIDDHGHHEMWFSYRSGRGESYRIGYATSPDGNEWTLRLGEAGIEPSESGWDSEMIEYPYVFDHKDRRYMLYNGNGYGRSGFGLAVREAAA